MLSLNFCLLCIALISYSAHSTSVNIKKEEAYYFLSNAKTIAYGKLCEDKDGDRYLALENGWTLYPQKVYLPLDADEMYTVVTKPGVLGVKYLFFSAAETNINRKMKHEAIYYKPLREGKNLITRLAFNKDFDGEINPSWQFCESDNECSHTKNICGNPIAVNKKYKKNYLDFLKTKKGKVDCSKTIKVKSIVSRCVENFCN